MNPKPKCGLKCAQAVTTQQYEVRILRKGNVIERLRVVGARLQEGMLLDPAKGDRVQVLIPAPTDGGTVVTEVACAMPCQTPKDPPIHFHELMLAA